ncbi:MAG: hypothetical protein JST94_08575 [Bacteroidetes bacterium]|nr:hypothetical protein [Bacteroidota bacterium]
MIKILKKLQVILYCIRKINWIKFLKLYNTNATNILWFYPFYREHLGTQSIEREFGVIYCFIKHNICFKIYFGREIGRFKNCNIFFFPTVLYNKHGFINYTNILAYISKQLEEQGNKVYPNSKECLYWENKVYMHNMFRELNIKQPETIIIDKQFGRESKAPLEFPFLIKEPHSSSSMGLYKVDNNEIFIELLFGEKQLLAKNNHLILQKIIDMRRDMRVTIVGDEICLNYWRINKGKEWKPTATGYGSEVDFISFPEKWRSHIIKECLKFKMNTLGADITFENDDIESEPIFLEVSPFYQPNPKTDIHKLGVPYGVYKKQFRFFNSWDTKFVDIVFEIEEKIVLQHFNKKM